MSGAGVAANDGPGRRVEVGKIVGIHGLQGWLKLISYCEPREQLFEHRPLLIGNVSITEFEGKVHGKGLLIRLSGYPDRTSVEPFVGNTVSIARSQLPDLPDDEYYWADLEGLQVVNTAGEVLGRIARIMATGANDVLVVNGKRQLLIPFVQGRYVLDVDLEAGEMTVDWAADWL